MPTEPKRILFATIGSLGDLHPCLALGQELQRRGHSITIAATEFYRDKVESVGFSFRPMRPNWNPTDQELIRQCEDLQTGPEILYRKLILPHLADTYHDLLAASTEADLLIAGELVYAAPLVAEKLKCRWISMILSPSSFFLQLRSFGAGYRPGTDPFEEAGTASLLVCAPGLSPRDKALVESRAPPASPARTSQAMRSGSARQVFERPRAGAVLSADRPPPAGLASADPPAGICLP